MSKPRLDVAASLTLAHGHHRAGRLELAEQLYRSILEADPEHADANHLLGVLAYQAGDLEAATKLIAKAILRDGTRPAYLNNLGLVLQAQHRLGEALLLFTQATELDPGFTDARFNSGVVLETLGRLDEALAAYDQALQANPNHAGAHNSRGLLLHARSRFSEALSSFGRALVIDAEFAEAHNNRGNALEAQGRIGEAKSEYERALALAPGFAGAHSNLLLCLNYDDGADAATIHAAHREWNTRHAARLADAAPRHPNTRDPARRLRIGYVSPDFYRHPVATFVEPLLSSHDRKAFEVVCYSNVTRADDVTERLRALADGWRPIRGFPDQRVADLVMHDGIDILVDLAGHTAGHRLLVFARKPAPIQATYLGYPGTSGLSVMDYRLTDAWIDPPGTTDALYTETLVRLPGGSLCFRPPQSAPAVSPLPALEPGRVTFASFNNAAKLSPAAVALWARVLEAVPDARLLLKSRAFGDREAVERLTALFARHGVAADRLELVTWLPASADHLALYDRAHIALDTLPYSGCTTTCEALWMGVPVITLQNPEPRSRLSLGVLEQAGLSELIAESPEAYVELAKELATDIVRLGTIRAQLREKLRRSPLLDARAVTRAVESAYREMWLQYCS
jgi:predicted O-linked N-acetylglucosamine transferase (SPINDLY family)